MPSHLPTAEEQFVIYVQRLRHELNTAYTHYEIAKTLRQFRKTHRSDFSEAITFFEETINANLFATVMTINRFIDQRNDCLQLHDFFELIRKNLGLFSTPAFKKHLGDKGISEEDIEHWARLHIEITVKMVNEDEIKLKSVPITHLNSWRHKKLAHIDKIRALKNIDVMKEKPVTVKEIDDIITTLDEILNRYRIAYDGVQWAIGLPPVKQQMGYLMDAIKFYRQSRKEQK